MKLSQKIEDTIDAMSSRCHNSQDWGEYDLWGKYFYPVMEEVDELEKKLEVAKEALYKISAYDTLDGDKYNSYESAWHGVADYANEALKQLSNDEQGEGK
jgi:hypothetical protein